MSESLKKGLSVVVIVIVALAVLLVALAGFITNLLWFDDLGYISVFLKKLLTQLMIGVPVFVILFVLGSVYLSAINRGYHKRLIISKETMGKKGQRRLSFGIAALASLIITGTTVSRIWFNALQFANSTDFDIADPIFNLDVSFYVFRLQFIHDLNNIVIIGIIIFALMTFIYYSVLLSVAPPKAIPQSGDPDDPFDELGARRKTTKKAGGFTEGLFKAFGIDPEMMNANAGPKPEGISGNGVHFKELVYIASKQIIVLGILFFLMLGVNFFLRQYDLLYTSTDVLYGAGFTDINITLWVYRALVVLAVISAITFTIGITKKKVKTTIVVPIIMIVVGVVGMGAAGLVQQLIVSPDAINKEGQYLAHNIEFTQNAYGLQNVSVKPFAADDKLNGETILNNKETIRNIRINDYDPAKTFYNSTQSIRPYYSFNDVDVDRYMINGEYTQTFLSAREINEANITDQWLNKHLQYTHGYGVTLSRVDKVTSSGQPDVLIKNIPPDSLVDEIEITRPEIYFGELTNNYIVVNTDEEEFDYPGDDGNAYTKYEADSGIKLNLFNRIMFAITEQSMKLLVSSNIDSDSRMIINRNVTDRVEKILPMLSYAEPYMVTAEGKLYWIIDSFTTSRQYPYSEPYNLVVGDTTNYIRNSVKIVIDAYTGDTGYYIVDDNDPVAATLARIYPELFRNKADMPEGVAAHLRYPSKMLNIQAEVYKRYHVNDVRVFYLGEDRWDIAKEKLGASDKEIPMTSNYYIMKLPGEENVEFINSIPYTPKDKNNMTSLFVARNDGEHYGELLLFQFPKGKIVMGPSQIDAQIAQDTEISRDFSLWENSGSNYSRGNMFVIPIESSIMYVEPIYLQANDSSMPEVKRVIIYYNGQIAYEATLSEALDSMFGPGIGDATATPSDDVGSIDTNDPPAEDSEQEDASGTTPAPSTPTPSVPSTSSPDVSGMTQEELIIGANEAFDNAEAAQKAGDWAKYGQELDKLKSYLEQLTGEGARPAVPVPDQSEEGSDDAEAEEDNEQ